MLAEVAGPDQRAAKKMRPGHCTKKFHPGSPGVTFLGTDTSFAQSHPPLKIQLNPESIICRDPDPGSFSICEI